MLANMLANMLAGTANQTNIHLDQQCWPTFIKKLINVGQHFLTIFSFTNMLVGTAKQFSLVSQFVQMHLTFYRIIPHTPIRTETF